ncbi:gamma-F420-2:alpha-L-glutamate ligase [Anaerotaenia torta]|uniref:ATP-grasp domain-containing protein n=1 Tax=Anaerotaenia torta TaxID=433293 RepID=UPI003D1C8F0D
MVGWIIYYRDSAVYNKNYIQFYLEEGRRLGIEIRLLLVEEIEFGIREGGYFLTYKGQKPEQPDFAICRAIYPLLNRHLEAMGIRVFNNSMVSEICNDKARTYQYLAKTGIKMVDTCFCRNNQLDAVMNTAKEPVVIKAVDGHGGTQVFLYQGEQASSGSVCEKKEFWEGTSPASLIRTGIGSSDLVVQPLTGSRHQDLRVYILGREIVAAVLRTAKEGFKSNFSLGGEVSLYSLGQEEIAIVDRITSEFDFGLVGIDFIIGDEGELIFNEIEDVVGSRMLYQCSDLNIVERYLNFIRSACLV